MIYLRQSTASQEVPLGYFVDSTDGDTEETALTIANTDIKLWKAGATTLANKNSGGATHISNGIYYAVLDATDTNTLGSLVIFVHPTGALSVRLECVVLAANVYDSMIAASDSLEVDAVAVSGNTTAADNAETAFTGTITSFDGLDTAQDSQHASTQALVTTVDTVVDGIQTDLDNATDGLGAIKTAVDAIPTSNPTAAAIADAVLDEALSGHVVAGSLGKAVADIETDATAILADSNELQTDWADGGRLDLILDARASQTSVDTVDANVDAILVDTGTTLENHLTDIKGATFSGATDSLEAIRDRGDAAWTTGAGGTPPQLLQNTTIATLASQTSFTLTDGSADDDAYNGAVVVVTDSATSTQKAVGSVLDYTGSTKTVTLTSDPGIFTMAVGDTIDIIANASTAPTAAAVRAEIDANSTQLAAILADTAEIGTAGAGLTAVPWNASWDVEVQSEVDDALTAFWTSPATLVDLVWDEVITGASHNVNNSAARFLREAAEAVAGTTGTAQGPGTGNNQIQLASGAISTDDLFNGERVTLIEGTGAGQSRLISDSVASTDTLTVAHDWTVNPSTDTVYAIMGAEVDVRAIAEQAVSATAPVDFDDLSSILTDTGTTIPAQLSTIDTNVSAILVDTNELQGDWTDGGRLDLIIDAILDDTGTSGVLLTATERNAIADAILDRDMSTGADSGSASVRTVRQALRFNRNKVGISGGTLTIYKEDDTTASWTAAVTTTAGDPISDVDPAS